MFGRKGADGAEQETTETTHADSPATPRATDHAPRANSPLSARRVVAGASSRNSTSAGDRRLQVGPGLSLNGEIASCDVLVVEGKVEAKLSEGKLLEITESGQFRGNVEIENADIAGRYDGQLIVHGRLTVRATGRISGMVKYGELEVSAGGQIIGEMQITGSGMQEQQRGAPAFKGASKFSATAPTTAVADDEDDATKTAEQRKSA